MRFWNRNISLCCAYVFMACQLLNCSQVHLEACEAPRYKGVSKVVWPGHAVYLGEFSAVQQPEPGPEFGYTFKHRQIVTSLLVSVSEYSFRLGRKRDCPCKCFRDKSIFLLNPNQSILKIYVIPGQCDILRDPQSCVYQKSNLIGEPFATDLSLSANGTVFLYPFRSFDESFVFVESQCLSDFGIGFSQFFNSICRVQWQVSQLSFSVEPTAEISQFQINGCKGWRFGVFEGTTPPPFLVFGIQTLVELSEREDLGVFSSKEPPEMFQAGAISGTCGGRVQGLYSVEILLDGFRNLLVTTPVVGAYTITQASANAFSSVPIENDRRNFVGVSSGHNNKRLGESPSKRCSQLEIECSRSEYHAFRHPCQVDSVRAGETITNVSQSPSFYLSENRPVWPIRFLSEISSVNLIVASSRIDTDQFAQIILSYGPVRALNSKRFETQRAGSVGLDCNPVAFAVIPRHFADVEHTLKEIKVAAYSAWLNLVSCCEGADTSPSITCICYMLKHFNSSFNANKPLGQIAPPNAEVSIINVSPITETFNGKLLSATRFLSETVQLAQANLRYGPVCALKLEPFLLLTPISRVAI